MSRLIPYGIRTLALSHARAWPTAFWTAGVTALAGGLALSTTGWLSLAALTVVCGSAVRMITAQVVEAWLTEHPDVRAWISTQPEAHSDFDNATLHALSTLA